MANCGTVFRRSSRFLVSGCNGMFGPLDAAMGMIPMRTIYIVVQYGMIPLWFGTVPLSGVVWYSTFGPVSKLIPTLLAGYQPL